MRPSYLNSVKAGDIVEDVFVISNTQLAAGSNGKHYVKAFVSDRTAQITARLWNASREMFAQIPDNAFLRIRGRVENYQNNLQLIIESFSPAKPNTFDAADLLPATPKDIDAMTQRLFEVLDTVQHVPTRAILQAFLDDEDLMNDLAHAPAASSFHHAYIGGLLEHTLNLIEIADRLLPLYPKLSRDLVLAGLFLHDIGKTWELSYDAAFAYTDGGQLVGHIVKAALMVERKAEIASRTTPIPRELIDVLQHIVLSHHEKLEFGSPKTPATPEAVFVSLVDNLDAKTSMALAACRDAPNPENSRWTDNLKPFGQRFFRPDVTAPPPPEATVAPATPQQVPRATPAPESGLHANGHPSGRTAPPPPPPRSEGGATSNGSSGPPHSAPTPPAAPRGVAPAVMNGPTVVRPAGGEPGQRESGRAESGKGEAGKGEPGKGESGKGESGKGESGKPPLSNPLFALDPPKKR
jgi:3'-5' exoribonuclease